MPLGGVWIDGFVYFTSSPDAVKAKNLVKNPACSISVSTADFDLIIEGEASRVTDAPELERLAAEYREGGWPAQVESGAVTAPFSAPSAGPPPWYVYKLIPDTIYALGTSEPYGATRFRSRPSTSRPRDASRSRPAAGGSRPSAGSVAVQDGACAMACTKP